MFELLREIFLTVAALVPAVVLCVFIYIKDKTEKEPLSLLALLFGFGVLTIVPAIFFEKIFGFVNSLIFSPFLVPGTETIHLPPFEALYQFFEAFFVVALVEESVKWLALRIGTLKEKHFNSFFDGIIYSVFVSLGFAAFENVQYVSMYGFGTALIRAVLSVPAHMFFAVFMGYFFSLHIVNLKGIQAEKNLRTQGLLPEGPARIGYSFSGPLSLIVPVLAHGLYDFCLFWYNPLTMVIFFVFVTFMYIFCFSQIHRASVSDHQHCSLIFKILKRKYPQLTE